MCLIYFCPYMHQAMLAVMKSIHHYIIFCFGKTLFICYNIFTYWYSMFLWNICLFKYELPFVVLNVHIH